MELPGKKSLGNRWFKDFLKVQDQSRISKAFLNFDLIGGDTPATHECECLQELCSENLDSKGATYLN